MSSTLGGQALRSRESVSRCWKLTLSSAWPVPIDRHQDAEPLRLAFALLTVSRPDSDLLHLDVSRKKAAAPKTPTKPDLEEEQRFLLASYAQFFCNLCATIGLECCVFMLPKRYLLSLLVSRHTLRNPKWANRVACSAERRHKVSSPRLECVSLSECFQFSPPCQQLHDCRT